MESKMTVKNEENYNGEDDNSEESDDDGVDQ